MKTQDNTYYVSGQDMKDVMTHLQQQGTYFIAGSNSIYVPKGKRRYVDKAACKEWADIDGQLRLMTPGQAARTELLREWPLLGRVGWSPSQVSLLDWRSPIHYSGPRAGNLVYIDLDGAYGQIYEKLWLDTAYPQGYYGRYPLASVANRLSVWKAARNSLVGICRSREGVAYRGQRRIRLKMKNRYLSPGLWATIQNTLHWVAHKALELDALYINVDGYIFDLEYPEFPEAFMFWLSENGFRWSLRASGWGKIVSWNNYVIGQKKTRANELGLIQNSKEFSNVSDKHNQTWEKYWCGLNRIWGATNGA